MLLILDLRLGNKLRMRRIRRFSDFFKSIQLFPKSLIAIAMLAPTQNRLFNMSLLSSEMELAHCER